MAAAKTAAVSTRFRTQREYEQVKKAAKLTRQSINEFVTSSAVKAAAELLTKNVIATNPEAA